MTEIVMGKNIFKRLKGKFKSNYGIALLTGKKQKGKLIIEDVIFPNQISESSYANVFNEGLLKYHRFIDTNTHKFIYVVGIGFYKGSVNTPFTSFSEKECVQKMRKGVGIVFDKMGKWKVIR